MILKAMDAPLEQLIHSLESYTSEELDEKWLYELAELYHEAGDAARCVSTCDKIMLMFGLGKYVDKAMELKIQYAPLNKYQMDLVENRDKYEEKLRAVEQSSGADLEESEDTEEAGEMEETAPREPDFEESPAPALAFEDAEFEATPAERAVEEAESAYEREAIAAALKQAEVEKSLRARCPGFRMSPRRKMRMTWVRPGYSVRSNGHRAGRNRSRPLLPGWRFSVKALMKRMSQRRKHGLRSWMMQMSQNCRGWPIT